MLTLLKTSDYIAITTIGLISLTVISFSILLYITYAQTKKDSQDEINP